MTPRNAERYVSSYHNQIWGEERFTAGQNTSCPSFIWSVFARVWEWLQRSRQSGPGLDPRVLYLLGAVSVHLCQRQLWLPWSAFCGPHTHTHSQPPATIAGAPLISDGSRGVDKSCLNMLRMGFTALGTCANSDSWCVNSKQHHSNVQPKERRFAVDLHPSPSATSFTRKCVLLIMRAVFLKILHIFILSFDRIKLTYSANQSSA